MSTEIELKLIVASKDLPRLREVLRQYDDTAKAKRRHLLNHYYDTADAALWTSGVALRVRRIDGHWVQTLKGNGGVYAGVHQRAEWETPVSDNCPNPDRLISTFPDDTELQKLIQKLRKQENIHAVFSTDFYREARIVKLSDGSEIEVAVDEGEVVVGKRRKPICELELELKSGNTVAVFDFARRLLVDVPLSIGIVTKAERGYALVQPAQQSAPRRAKSVAPIASSTVENVFADIFSECFSHLLENIDGVLEGRDPEYLHQLRVAIRRFRGALSVFSDVVPKQMMAHIAGELQKAGQVLGDARNWDVFQHETLPAYTKETNTVLSEAFLAHLQQRSRRAAANAKRLVRSQRFVDALLTIGALIVGRNWRNAATETTLNALAQPVGIFAQQVIEKRHKRLKKAVAAIAPEHLETLHAVRIAGKKLRYSTQFFASLFSNKRAEPYADTLADIQDLLGRVNDAVIAQHLLSEMERRLAELSTEATLVNTWLQQRLQKDQDLFSKVWRRFSKLPALT